MPEEVNIDDLIDLPADEERVKKLQVTRTVGTRGCRLLNRNTYFLIIFFFYFKFCHQLVSSHLMVTDSTPTWIDFV